LRKEAVRWTKAIPICIRGSVIYQDKFSKGLSAASPCGGRFPADAIFAAGFGESMAGVEAALARPEPPLDRPFRSEVGDGLAAIWDVMEALMTRE
jgi:hypothetical protein